MTHTLTYYNSRTIFFTTDLKGYLSKGWPPHNPNNPQPGRDVFFFLFFEVVLTSRPDDAQCRATLPISRILGRIGGSQVTTDMRDHAFFHVPTREV